MKKKHKSRRNINYIHAKRRIRDRFGIKLSKKIYSKINSIIQKGEAYLIERQFNDRALYRIVFNGEELIVAYDRKYGGIVTALPKDNRRYKEDFEM